MKEMNTIAKRIIAEWGILAYCVMYTVAVSLIIGVMKLRDEYWAAEPPLNQEKP